MVMASRLYAVFVPDRSAAGISLPFPTRQELIPSTALASLSISDNRSMWIPKGSEILGLCAYLRPAPGTIPEMRLDLFGLRLHRCNQLEIVKGGFHSRTPESRKSTTD
jgi:hypothetical protein